MFDVYLAQTAVLICGMAFAAWFAYQAFDTPPIKLGDGPTLPRYMTQPKQYRLGLIVFIGTCLLLYSLIAYFHQELLPIVGAINPDLKRAIEGVMKNGSLSYPLSVIFSAAIFVSLLKVEKDWNPIFVLRRVIHGWVSIPEIANALMIKIRDELDVPVGARADVAADPDVPYVTVGDFDKGRRTVDRNWAELCYIRHWLERHRAQGSHFTFFNEPSFEWQKLQTEYKDALDHIAPAKLGEVKDGSVILGDIAKMIEALRWKYCRLAACFLIFRNETQKEALRDARQQFGVSVLPEAEAPRANPLRYVAIIVVTIIIAVYLGVSASAVSWDLLHHNQITVGSEIATKWVLFGLANYGMPIIAVLLLRYLGWRVDRSQPNSYLASYATIFVVALCVSAICLCLAQMALGPAAIADIGQFLERLRANLKWGLSPAVVAIYMIYHVDRQIDPGLPDIGPSEHWRLPQQLMSCIFFGLLVTGFSVLPTLDIEQSRSAWTLDKLRIVILGTTFIVGLTMALVGEFLLVAPTTASGRPELTAGPPATRFHARTKLLAVTGSLVAVLLVGVAVWASSLSSVPQWAFDKKRVYLAERVPLTWTYKQPDPSTPVHFELQSGVAGQFKSEWCTDADHYHVNRVNGSQEWRVRAVEDCNGKAPISGWSQAIEITQYDNIYQRIKGTGQVNIFVSKSQDQDFFKWGNQGFDIELANVIVRDLSVLMNRQLKLHWTSVRWEDLLPAAGNSSADLAISSITKKEWREQKFAIRFSDGYYCTGYALIYRNGTRDVPFPDLIKGKIVGVQHETTSATLAEQLAAGKLFTVREFDTNEALQDELVASKIDFGLTDTAFAQSVQLDTGGRLKFKQLRPDELGATEEEAFQEYAVAVQSNEGDLLRAVNQTLARIKENGELTRLAKSAAVDYERFKKYQPASRSVGDRPWECFGRTASGN